MIRIFPIGKKSDLVSKFQIFCSNSLWVGVTFFSPQNFVRCSSSEINLLYFGKFVIRIFPIGKKSDFENFENYDQNHHL